MSDRFPKPDSTWRLSLEVNLVEAILLVLDIEPQGLSEIVEGLPQSEQPKNYTAIKSAILSGSLSGILGANLVRHEGRMFDDRNPSDTSMIDLTASTINLVTLKNWLLLMGYEEGGLFRRENQSETFENPDHPRFSPKLAAAVAAWRNFKDVENSAGTVKQRLEKWLRLHANEFGLVDEDGSPQETVIRELAKVANWNVSGGAPKAEDRLSDAD